MSRRKVKARDRTTLKNTRDGIVERNTTTGEDTQVSKRDDVFDLRGETRERETFSQVGKSEQAQTPQEQNAKRRQTYRHSQAEAAQESERQQGFSNEPDKRSTLHQTDNQPIQNDSTQSDVVDYGTENAPNVQAAQPAPLANNGRVSSAPPTAKSKPPPVIPSKRHKQYSQHQPVQVEPVTTTVVTTAPPVHDAVSDKAADTRKPVEPTADNAAVQTETVKPKLQTDKPDTKLNTDNNSRLQFTQDEAATAPQGKRKQQKPLVDDKTKPAQDGTAEQPKPVDEPVKDAPATTQSDSTAQPDAAPLMKPKSKKPDATAQQSTALKPDKPGKLQFTPDEATPDTPKATHNRKLVKAETQMERATGKLERAQDKLPSKKKLRKVTVTDEKSGTVKQRLQFEKTPISQGEHIRGALPMRPVKTAANFAMVSAHTKLFQVEHENVGVKAAHRAEMVGEAGVRTALRFHKTAPYRKVAKLEQAARKKSINLPHQKTLAQNPKLKSNVFTRMMQKRKIKKDYAKAAREAQKAAKRAKQAGSATVRAGKAIVRAVIKNPKVLLIVGIVVLVLFLIMSLVSLFGSLGGGGVAGISVGTYLAEDADIIGAQAQYAGMEADLQNSLDNYATLNPGYDEYVFHLDTIWHDPYVLIAILSAMHEGAWTLDDVQATLAFLFERQYILTETTTTETRTRPEPVLDSTTGLPTDETEDVPYEHSIRTVTLENFNLSHLPIYIMGESGVSRYAMFMMTLGNRPDLFPVSSFPNASYYRDYGRHDIPQAYLDADPIFAGMIAEANKWLGMPYVWGGSSPITSFDCSGYVSWVLNNSGWNIGRLGAQGLYNISTPVTAANARPGDLVFFHSTYNAPNPNGVTHVGIYVGDGMMVHAGNPIGYASINTTYWQNHFFAFGRMY